MSRSVAATPKLILALTLIGISLYLLARIFADPVKQEVHYTVTTTNATVPIAPPNTDFAIVIDKIRAASAIIPGVDPYDSRIYQLALTKGVAQAKGTKLPGQGGNIFLFAHSSADLLTAERYNSIFYLAHHLVNGDQIEIWYHNRLFPYVVTGKKIVAPTDTSYLTTKTTGEQLTLMTCWPPGTTLQRLIIIAKPAGSE
jgi:sortase A